MAAEKKESETFDEASRNLQKYIDELMKKLEPPSAKKETDDGTKEKVHVAGTAPEQSPAVGVHPAAAASADERFARIEKKVSELEKIAKKIGELKKADFATKEDVKRLEEKIMGIPRVVNGLVEIQRSLVSLQQKHRVPPKPGKHPLPPRRSELAGEREKLLKLMENAENEYKEGLISRESYEEIKRKNEQRLGKIQKLLGS